MLLKSNIQIKLEQWAKRVVSIKDYSEWKAEGLFLLGLQIRSKQYGERFSETEEYINLLFPNDPDAINKIERWAR